MATKSTKEVVAEATKEVKSWLNKDTMDKIIKTLSYLPIPLAVILGIWGGSDAMVYVEAGIACLISLCSFIELFLKD